MGSETVRKKPVVEVAVSRHRPTPEDMEKDVSIDATPEEVARALFAGDPAVVKSGKGEKSRRLWERWLKRRG